MTLKTAPGDPGGIAATNRRTPDPSAAIIARLPEARNSAKCLRSTVPAPVAAGRCSPAVTPRTPSRSRSTCEPTAGSSVNAATSGPAPATVRSHPHRPPPPKLIPKGRYGYSVWVEILLDKYLSYRPTERLLASWRTLGLDLAPGTVTDGLSRLGVLLEPIDRAIQGAESPRGLASRR